MRAFSSFPVTTSCILSLPVSLGRYFSGRYPLSSHSSVSLSVETDEDLSSESTSVIFSPSSPSLSSLVSPLSIIDTGSVFTFVLEVELDIVANVVAVGLLTLAFVLIFPFCRDFLYVVFFANVTIFLGEVASVVV